MNTDTPTAPARSVFDMLAFIKKYKALEALSYEDSFKVIRHICSLNGTPEDHKHLCDQWRWKKKDFASFYLNLDYKLHISFLRYWDFPVDGADTYLKTCEEKPMAALFLDPPEIVTTFKNVLLYFNNHGIGEWPSGDLHLTTLPPANKQYGNGSNWGSYILSLPNHEMARVLTTIRDHYSK